MPDGSVAGGECNNMKNKAIDLMHTKEPIVDESVQYSIDGRYDCTAFMKTNFWGYTKNIYTVLCGTTIKLNGIVSEQLGLPSVMGKCLKMLLKILLHGF